MAVQEKFDLVIRAQDEATATLRNVNREVERIGGSSVPRLNTGMASYNREMTRATTVTASMAGQVAGLHPKLSSMAGAFLFTSPAVAAVSVAVGLLAREIVSIGEKTNETTEIINKHREAIQQLANSNQQEAETARALLETRRRDLQAQLAIAQANLASLQSEALSGIETYLSLSRILGPLLVKSTADGGAGVASLVAKIADLKASLGLLSGQMYGPTRDDFERFIAQEKQAAKDAEMLNKALREQSRLLQGLAQGQFRGIGSDASLRGPDYFGVPQDEVDKAKEEAEKAMQSIWAIPEAETRMIADAQAQWMEFSSMVLSSTDQLSAGITDMFFGLRDSLADVFRSMAANWIRYFINEILKQTALRLGLQFFNFIFPGSGNIIGPAGDTTSQGFSPIPKLAVSGGGGLDIVSAGAKRFTGGGPTGASTTVIIQGDVIGDEQYVNKRIIPAIENAIRYQKTTIAGR